MSNTTTLIDGLCFAEGPRWRDGKLWFSDMHAHQVCTVDLEGNMEAIVQVLGQPSGLGWLPDGRMLVVSMVDRKLMVYGNGELSEFADLSNLATYHCNDMVVDSAGRAYIGNFGFDFGKGDDPVPAELVLVTPDGKARVVADDLAFPNGTVITPDNKTLIVGETMAARLTAFNIEQDGSLSNRRTWAQLDGPVPDGICLDSAAGIWLASPMSDEVVRVLEGGEVTDRIGLDSHGIACTLGGPDNRRLFILTSQSFADDECRQNRDAKIEFIDVEYPSAGSP